MKKTKLILTTLIIMLAIILLNTSEVHASLQANPNTYYTKTNSLDNWKKEIRKMEEQGEGMGLSETLNDDLTASSESNNIDVHMIKTTEYGAIAILSASGYGNSQTLQNSTIKTPTGNKTGIYFSGINWEWTAGGAAQDNNYFNSYSNVPRIGDALGGEKYNGCALWHGARGSGWISGGYSRFERGGSGLFSYSYGNRIWWK